MGDTSQETQTLTIEPHFLISVKDFAYDEDDELHYGVIDYDDYSQQDDNDYDDNDYNENNSHIIRKSIINLPNYKYFQDGPPWQEDADLKTPNYNYEAESGKEYEFSISSTDEIHGKAIALFDFEPENDNEVGLKEGQIIWISYRHGQGWLVAEDPQTGETGLVPEEYVQLINNGKYYEEEEDEPRQVLPNLMKNDQYGYEEENDSDWVDEEIEEEDDDGVPNVGNLKIK